MIDDITEITRTLELKGREFDANREIFRNRIVEGFRTAQERLKRAEDELLRMLDVFFGENEFTEQLAILDASDPNALRKAACVASAPVPAAFGPDEEAFGRLYKEIGRIADKYSRPLNSLAAVLPEAPKDLAARGVGKGEFHSGVSLSWAAVPPPEAACGVERVGYKVRVVSEYGVVREYDSAGTACVFQNLRPGAMYAFSVRCVWDGRAGPWCSAVEFTTSPIPVPRNVRCTEARESEVSVVWDAAPVDVVWEVEVGRSGVFRGVYEGRDASCTVRSLDCGAEYLVRVRARMEDGKCGEWCEAVTVRTKKWVCSWKQCPADVEDGKKYVLSGSEGKIGNIATSLGKKDPVVIGDNPIPVGTKVSWEVKLGYGSEPYSTPGSFHVGVAFADVDQNNPGNLNKNAIYIDCVDCSIYSLNGSHDISSHICGKLHCHSYSSCYSRDHKCYLSGQGKIGVIVDTHERNIVFVNGDVVLGTVRQIPLDKPLVPFVRFGYLCKSAELVIN